MARRRMARALEVSRRDEARYVRSLLRVSRDVHARIMSWLLPQIDSKQDAFTALSSEYDLEVMKVLAAIPDTVGPLFERHAKLVAKANADALRVVGIHAVDHRVAEELAKRKAHNIQLVLDSQRAYAESVKAIFEDPENFGLRVEELKAKLLARGDVSESRAELLARDQTLKLNGALTQIRQENAGVSSYVWSTSRDDRVRPSHRVLEGKTFSWMSPPPNVGHPGQDVQCRCVAVPVIEELKGL